VITARLTGLIFLGLFIAYGYQAQEIQLDFWASAEIFDARTFPELIALAGVLCSTLLIIFPTAVPVPELKGTLLRPAILIVLMLGYSFSIEPLGFIASTALFLTLGFMVLEAGLVIEEDAPETAEETAKPRPNEHAAVQTASSATKSVVKKVSIALAVSVLFYALMTWLGIHLDLGILSMNNA
jgi:putative tricarboxylic transport membrane protein